MKKRVRNSFFFVMMIVIFVVVGCSKSENFQDYLDLGQKYQTEQKYEEAIVAFSKAIELEPNALAAYSGLARVYIEQENYMLAEDALKESAAIYEKIPEKTDELVAWYEELRALQEKLQLLTANTEADEAEDPDDSDAFQRTAENTRQQQIKEIEEVYMGALKQVIELMDTDIEKLLMNSWISVDFFRLAATIESPIIWTQEDGRYLALYPEGCIYIGEMENSMREGFGKWYVAFEAALDDKDNPNNENYYAIYFEGEWETDYPNGTGTQWSYNEWYDQENPGNTARWEICTRTGNLKDGYEDGMITMVRRWIGSYSDDPKKVTEEHFSYHTVNGIPDKIDDNPRRNDASYIYARGENSRMSISWDPEKSTPFGVFKAKNANGSSVLNIQNTTKTNVVRIDLADRLGNDNNYSCEYGIIAAYDNEDNVLWEYTTPKYEQTELNQIEEIGWKDNVYYFNQSGSIIALDAETGVILWENSDFSGASIGYAFGKDAIYLCGYDGPDFYAVSYMGETLYRIEHFYENYYWSQEIELNEEQAVVYLHGGKNVERDNPVAVYVDLNTGDYSMYPDERMQ